MNKLIIVGFLMFGFFIFQSSLDENESIEGILEIVSPTNCINFDDNFNNCEEFDFQNSQITSCNDENRYVYTFKKGTLIEFLVIESDNKNEQSLFLEINNVSTKHKIINGFLWVDINYELSQIKLISKDFCDIRSLTFYGRQ